MVFVLRPLTQAQEAESQSEDAYEYKSWFVICGNFASWSETSTTTTNLDAPLLRLTFLCVMLQADCSEVKTSQTGNLLCFNKGDGITSDRRWW